MRLRVLDARQVWYSLIRALHTENCAEDMMDLYGDMASGLKECLTNMGPWSLGDLTLGIRHVGKRHDRQDISDRLPGPPLQGRTSVDTYAFLRREIKFTQSAYSIADAPAIVATAELPNEDNVLHMSIETAKFRPAYILIKDTEAKLIRIVVRGTQDLHDVLTDSANPSCPLHSAFRASIQYNTLIFSRKYMPDPVDGVLCSGRCGCAGSGRQRT